MAQKEKSNEQEAEETEKIMAGETSMELPKATKKEEEQKEQKQEASDTADYMFGAGGDDNLLSSGPKKVEKLAEVVEAEPPKPSEGGNKEDDAILVTGATHSRELLSMQVPMYMALKLLHQGIVQDKTKYQQMLATTKFHFVPVINVDGANFVEENWLDKKVIVDKRKNMNPANEGYCEKENSGVDLNRNYGVDWTAEN